MKIPNRLLDVLTIHNRLKNATQTTGEAHNRIQVNEVFEQ